MNYNDTLKEIQIWEKLKVNYQEEIEIGKNIEQNTYLVKHADEQIVLLKMKLIHYEQDTLLRTTPSYATAWQIFENQTADWKPNSEQTQEFRNLCKSNFITGYLTAKNEEGVTPELLTALHDKAMKNFDKARALQETIMIHLHKHYLVQIFCVTSDGTFLNSLDFKVVPKKKEEDVAVDLERRIIQELNEEYNPQLYQVVTETIYAFKKLLITKIKKNYNI